MERMTDAEAIEFLYDLLETTDHKVRHEEAVKIAEDAIEKQSMVNEILNEAEQYKLALFAVLRTHSMEVAMEKGLSTEEHSMLAVKIMHQIIEKCNFETLKVLYDEALAKMGGK